MLVTNSIKNDLNNPNQFISGTALCALGNIGNQEMCIALSREVQNQLTVDNPLIRKKAALCAMRIIKKVDEIEDKFSNKITTLLEDKNHGVILSACSLLVHVLENNPEEYLPQFKHCPSILIKTLKMILMSGYTNSTEYEFSGIVDPFLQVKILRLIRLFHTYIAPDELNDVLAQIATNTDSSKNAGNAVLYECVQTIMAIPSAESGLRILGINILGRFLSNKDNNIRYVALQMLQKVVLIDPKSVQRHRTTVLECLRDNDISIQRRALDVAYSLVNTENVESVTREMISYLVQADSEFKPDLASRICMCIDKFAPTKKWHIDNTIKVLSIAGNEIGDDIVFSLCHVVAGCIELHAYSVWNFFYTIIDLEIDYPDSLLIVGIWIIGEYGHLLTTSPPPSGSPQISFNDIIDLFECILRRALVAASDQAVVAKQQASFASISHRSSVTVCEYIVTAITKLIIKTKSLGQPGLKSRVEKILSRFDGSLHVDLQQRVCEFMKILSAWDDQTRSGLVEVMPPSEKTSAIDVKDKPTGGPISLAEAIPASAHQLMSVMRETAVSNSTTVPTRRTFIVNTSSSKAEKVAGFDLDDLLGDSTVIPQQAAKTAPVVSANDDLLKDIFG
jgi:AP-1 complex subunit gamma-1